MNDLINLALLKKDGPINTTSFTKCFTMTAISFGLIKGRTVILGVSNSEFHGPFVLKYTDKGIQFDFAYEERSSLYKVYFLYCFCA